MSISTIVRKLNAHRAIAVALFFVGTSLLASFAFSSKLGLIEEKGVLGGPSVSYGNIVISAADAADNTSFSTGFGNTQNTENQDIAPSFYNLSGASIKDLGPVIANSVLTSSEADSQVTTKDKTLPNFNRQFILPTTGHNWGVLHDYNAVDIANSCGTPVKAAAEGVVIPDPETPNITDGWNGGYGNFVLIQHVFGNNIDTRYAHLQTVLVKVGDYVKQGQEIGLMGETGDATGCHLHFEVIGAQNPFAK